jgi:hypothetical protein
MMGINDRSLAALPRDLSLEELIPKENLYRRLHDALDLSFLRELVRPLYAGAGRPSVDPVVFFKLQLVMFFEDLRSERQLMRVVADRLSLRWYLGYDLHEPLPDHSSLTRILKSATALQPSGVSSSGSWRCALRRGWLRAESCTMAPPRSKPTPRWTRRGRARSWRGGSGST